MSLHDVDILIYLFMMQTFLYVSSDTRWTETNRSYSSWLWWTFYVLFITFVYL